jgi:hypothetical protein
MKTDAILVAAILIPALIIIPVHAVSIEEIDTGSLDIPEPDKLNFSATPLGSLESLLTYTERLIKAADELLNFIESMFSMLGMVNDPDVENLMKILKEGANLTKT